MRWYREVDRDGRLLENPRYQNPKCVSYLLPLDNQGLPFYWTASVQLISKVYLRKHPRQPRTYTVNTKDKTMVRDSLAKKMGVTQPVTRPVAKPRSQPAAKPTRKRKASTSRRFDDSSEDDTRDSSTIGAERCPDSSDEPPELDSSDEDN